MALTSVLSRQSVNPASRSFGAVAIPLSARSIYYEINVTGQVDPDSEWFLLIEFSADGGVTWPHHAGTGRRGGVKLDGHTGLPHTHTTGWRDLPPGGPWTHARGTLTVNQVIVLGVDLEFRATRPSSPVIVEPPPTHHSLTFDAATSAGDNTNASSASFSHVAGANAKILVALPVIEENGTPANRDITNVTWNGAAITSLREDDNGTNSVRSEVWYILSPATGTLTAVFTAAGIVDELSGGIVTLNDDVGEPTIDAHNGETGAAANPDVSVTTVADNAWICAVLITLEGNPANVAVTSPGVERWETDVGGNVVSGQTSGPVSPAGATAVGWTISTSDGYAISAVSVAPAVAAGGATHPSWNGGGGGW